MKKTDTNDIIYLLFGYFIENFGDILVSRIHWAVSVVIQSYVGKRKPFIATTFTQRLTQHLTWLEKKILQVSMNK